MTEITIASQRTRVAEGRPGSTDLHREIKHGVVVPAEGAAGSELIRQLVDPPFTASLGVERKALQAAEPSRDIAVHDYRAFASVKRQPGGAGVRPYTRQRPQLLQVLGRSSAALGDPLSRCLQQRPAPVKAERIGYARCLSWPNRSQSSRRRIARLEGLEASLRLPRTRALEHHLGNQRQPWIGLVTP